MAVLAAAEETKSPVIMQTTSGTIKKTGLDYFYGMVKAAAERASVPVALHLDHGDGYDRCMKALRTGYTSVMIDGSHESFEDNIALTKLDVLSEFDTIKVCVAYDCDGVRYTSVPEHAAAFASAVPVYEELPGWKCDITGCRTFDELPQAARDYVAYIEKLAGCKISFVAVGPDREQTIVRDW